MNCARRVFAFLCAVIFSGVAGAATLYTDFGPGQSYNTSAWLGIFGSGFYQAIAGSFTPSVSATLDSIDLPVFVTSGTATFTVEIASNSSGAPGAVLESISLGSITNSPTIRTLTSILHPSLSNLSTYWIVVLGDATTSGGWNANSVGSLGLDVSHNGSTWGANPGAPTPAFDIIGTPTVPEPATWILLAAPLAAILWFRRRRT